MNDAIRHVTMTDAVTRVTIASESDLDEEWSWDLHDGSGVSQDALNDLAT